MSVKYMSHTIKKAIYNGFGDGGSKKEIPVNIHGTISVSKNMVPGVINVAYVFVIGDTESDPVMKVITETVFEYSEDNDTQEESIKKECLPSAITKTKSDVEQLMLDYGIDNLVLPETIWR